MKTIFVFALCITGILLTGCQLEGSESQQVTETKMLTPRTPVTSTEINIPQTHQTARMHSTKTPGIGNAVYKCIQPNGSSTYSDTACGTNSEIIPMKQLRPMTANAPRPAYTHVATSPTKDSRPNNPVPRTNPYEINTRYDNLTRDIKGMFEHDEKAQLNRMLLALERDRSIALNMVMQDKQTHGINVKFDNLARDLRSTHRGKSPRLAQQLLDLERSRNEALYMYQ